MIIEKKFIIYCEENENYKKDIEIFRNNINNLNRELKEIKEIIKILDNQNNILSKELNYIIERDKELTKEFQIVEHLKEVTNKNTQIMNNCIDS